MSKSKYQASIVIGRFQIFTKAHQNLIQTAANISDNVIICLGSCNRPRSIKNPFNAVERSQMVRTSFEPTSEIQKKISFVHIDDYTYSDNDWIMQLQYKVDQRLERLGVDPDTASVALVGHKKDHSSYYLDLFPQWNLEEIGESDGGLNATDLRDMFFSLETNISSKKIAPFVSEKVLEILEEFKKTNEFKQLALEHMYIQNYKKAWSAAPYAPTFVTVDAVVVKSGHVLVIKRKAEPGKGLMALPGGFLDQNEYIENAMVRELREETKLKVPDPVIKGSIKEWHVFDHPDRSFRGRTITHAAFVDLGSGPLPRVKGADDAERAFWVKLSDLDGRKMFEDHIDIIRYFVGGLL